MIFKGFAVATGVICSGCLASAAAVVMLSKAKHLWLLAHAQPGRSDQIPRFARNDNKELVRHLIACRNNVGALDHENYRSFRRARTMAHALRHDEALSRPKIDDAIFEIDQEPPI